MDCAHTSSSTTSSNVSGSYIGENNAKRENEFGVPASYISHRLLVFTGSIDVDLNKMLDGVFCPLVVLVGVAELPLVSMVLVMNHVVVSWELKVL